jgi:lysylphosphatidylglycerol synthetase-like protein (DUF2156 family)
MGYLYDFLKHATLIELGLVALAIITFVILILAGIWVAFYAKSRLTVGAYIAFALLPLFLCVLAIMAQWIHNRRLYSGVENPEAYYASDRADYLVGGIIGIFLTALPLVIGIAGLLIPRRRRGEPVTS